VTDLAFSPRKIAAGRFFNDWVVLAADASSALAWLVYFIVVVQMIGSYTVLGVILW